MLLITDSTDITLLDFKLTASLCDGNFKVDLSPSVFIAGRKAFILGASVEIKNPIGVTIKSLPATGFDINVATNGVFLQNIPLVAANFMYGTYDVKVLLKDSAGKIYTTAVKQVNICAPDKKNKNKKYGCITAAITGNCANGKVLFRLDAPPNYRGLMFADQETSLTLLMPTESGMAPVVVVNPVFSVQLYEGEYLLSGEICAQYNAADNVFYEIPYKVNCKKVIKCMIDECCVYEQIESLGERLKKACTKEEAEDIFSIILNAVRLLKTIQLATNCGKDPSENIIELEDLLGCSCTCACNEGTPILSSSVPTTDFNFQGCGFTQSVTGNTKTIIFTSKELTLLPGVGEFISISAPVVAIGGCTQTQTITFNPEKIPAPLGFAVTGESRSSVFGKMEAFSTLALANVSATPGETVLIYNDTTENLVAKNGVHYQGIGKHKVGKLVALNYTGTLANLVVNMGTNVLVQTIANSSKIGLSNIEFISSGDLAITGTSVLIGGLFSINGTVIISGTSKLLNANVNGKVSLTDNGVLDFATVIDSSGTASSAAVNMQGVSTTIYPTVSNCRVESLFNQGIASIYSTRIVNNYAKSDSKEGIYVHGGQPNVENRIVCTGNTGESLTGYGMSVVSNNGLVFTVNNLIDWQVANCIGISRDNAGIFLIEGNIRQCSGYSVESFGILVGGSDNPSSNVKVIECVGESRKNSGLYAARDIFIYGGTYISRSDSALTGSPIRLAHVPARTDNYHIVGVNTISVNTTVYSISVDPATPAPVIARISGCTFTNPYLATGVPGIDPAVTLRAVSVDAYGNMR